MLAFLLQKKFCLLNLRIKQVDRILIIDSVSEETSSRREPTLKNGSTASRWLSVFEGGTPTTLVSSLSTVKISPLICHSSDTLSTWIRGASLRRNVSGSSRAFRERALTLRRGSQGRQVFCRRKRQGFLFL